MLYELQKAIQIIQNKSRRQSVAAAVTMTDNKSNRSNHSIEHSYDNNGNNNNNDNPNDTLIIADSENQITFICGRKSSNHSDNHSLPSFLESLDPESIENTPLKKQVISLNYSNNNKDKTLELSETVDITIPTPIVPDSGIYETYFAVNLENENAEEIKETEMEECDAGAGASGSGASVSNPVTPPGFFQRLFGSSKKPSNDNQYPSMKNPKALKSKDKKKKKNNKNNSKKKNESALRKWDRKNISDMGGESNTVM